MSIYCKIRVHNAAVIFLKIAIAPLHDIFKEFTTVLSLLRFTLNFLADKLNAVNFVLSKKHKQLN